MQSHSVNKSLSAPLNNDQAQPSNPNIAAPCHAVRHLLAHPASQTTIPKSPVPPSAAPQKQSITSIVALLYPCPSTCRTCWDFELDALGLAHAPVAPALLAGHKHLPGALATGACRHLLERTQRGAHRLHKLPRALALGAGAGRGAGLHPAPITRLQGRQKGGTRKA